VNLPSHPRFRVALEALPARSADGLDLVLFRDLEGLTDGVAALPRPLGVLLLELLDGRRDLDALVRDLAAATGEAPDADVVRRLLAQLDGALLLEGERAEAARAEALSRWRAEPHRPAAHAGTCYPAEGDLLRQALADWGREAGALSFDLPVRAVLAPHIDPRGGAACHGAAARALAACPADVFVVLGTAHRPLRRPFALTSHDFDTPAGRLPTDRGLVERLARRGGGGLLDDERAHAAEHSVEFQAAWIRALRAGREETRIVPVLVGSFGEHIAAGRLPREVPAVSDFVDALAEALADLDGRAALVASVDLAHVGPAYGHATAPDEAALEAVRAADRALLARAAAVDADGWFRLLAEAGDAHNVCGAAPTWVFLAALAGRGVGGRLLRHDVWQIDPASGSHVSFAAMAFEDLENREIGR
jgi:AmmeMemoRadiSam system protein B